MSKEKERTSLEEVRSLIADGKITEEQALRERGWGVFPHPDGDPHVLDRKTGQWRRANLQEELARYEIDIRPLVAPVSRPDK